MSLLFIVEILLYYTCLIVISVKIFDCIILKTRITISFLIYIPWIMLSFTTSANMFYVICFAVHILNIVLLKISSKNLRTRSIIYSYLVLFFINSVLTPALITLLSISSATSKLLVEFVLHIIMTICCFIVGHTNLSLRIKRIILWTPKNIKYILLALVAVWTVVFILFFNIQRVVVNPSAMKFTLWVLAIFLILVCATFPILILNSVSSSYFKNLTENYERQISVQAEHYSALSKSNFELRRFSHDFNNIRVGISKLIEEGKYSEAIKMLDSSNTEIYQTTHSLLMYDTGNGIVDALLADKQQKAASSNIRIKFEGSVPQSSISSTELCVIFGNTVDNAIEACQKLARESEKVINITCQCNSGFMFLYISNPVNEIVEIYNNTLLTTKPDKTLHGFGLYSLDQIIQKHNGEIKYSCNYDLFELDISMCI